MSDYLDITLENCSVMLGIPAGRNPSWNTVTSLLGTFEKCRKLRIHVELGAITGCAIVTKARDEVVDHFLKSACDYLFWIDDDIEWDAQQFLRILALSIRYGIVGATYRAKLEGPATYFVKMDDVNDPEYGPCGLVRADGLGLGFCCMPRWVVREIVSQKPRMTDNQGKELASVFRTDIYKGMFRGEDIAFFADLRELGHNVWIDPSVELSHYGPTRYTGKLADALPAVV